MCYSEMTDTILLCFRCTVVIVVHLGDVVGPKVINEFVKPLFGFCAVGFGKFFQSFAKFSVQLWSTGHSVADFRTTIKHQNCISAFLS